jgi:hypothetical protein
MFKKIWVQISAATENFLKGLFVSFEFSQGIEKHFTTTDGATKVTKLQAKKSNPTNPPPSN